MSIVRNQASGGNTVLLSRHLVVVRLAQDVVVTPRNPFVATHSDTHSVCFSLLGLDSGRRL